MRERLEDGCNRKTWEKMMEPAYEFHPGLIKAAKCVASTYRANVSDPLYVEATVMGLSGDLAARDPETVISALASILHLASDSLDGIDIRQEDRWPDSPPVLSCAASRRRHIPPFGRERRRRIAGRFPR